MDEDLKDRFERAKRTGAVIFNKHQQELQKVADEQAKAAAHRAVWDSQTLTEIREAANIFNEEMSEIGYSAQYSLSGDFDQKIAEVMLTQEGNTRSAKVSFWLNGPMVLSAVKPRANAGNIYDREELGEPSSVSREKVAGILLDAIGS